MPGSVQVASKDGSRERCPLCRAPLAAEDQPTIYRCDACSTRSHVGCMRELNEGRCPTHGCARGLVRVVPAKPAPARSPAARWPMIVACLLALLSAGLGVGAYVITRGAVHDHDHVPPPLPVSPSAPAAEVRPAAPLPHVRPGQRWKYRMTTSGTAMEMIYTVRSIEPGFVRCEIQTSMDLGSGFQPVGDPTPFDYPRGAEHVASPGAAPSVMAATGQLTIDGLETPMPFAEMITGTTTTWLALSPEGLAVFPGALKSNTESSDPGRPEQGTTYELVSVEQPEVEVDAPRQARGGSR